MCFFEHTIFTNVINKYYIFQIWLVNKKRLDFYDFWLFTKSHKSQKSFWLFWLLTFWVWKKVMTFDIWLFSFYKKSWLLTSDFWLFLRCLGHPWCSFGILGRGRGGNSTWNMWSGSLSLIGPLCWICTLLSARYGLPWFGFTLFFFG